MDPGTLWSYITWPTTVAGSWLGSQNPRWGWVYGIVHQFVWVVEAYSTHRWGDLGNCVWFWFIYSRSLWRWRGTDFIPTAHKAVNKKRRVKRPIGLECRCGQPEHGAAVAVEPDGQTVGVGGGE